MADELTSSFAITCQMSKHMSTCLHVYLIAITYILVNTRASVRFFGKVFLSGKVSAGGNGANPDCGLLAARTSG